MTQAPHAHFHFLQPVRVRPLGLLSRHTAPNEVKHFAGREGHVGLNETGKYSRETLVTVVFEPSGDRPAEMGVFRERELESVS